MCMFCAAIPAALAVGANAQARHTRDERQGVRRRGRRTRVQPKTTTLLVVAGLATASVIYHTQTGG